MTTKPTRLTIRFDPGRMRGWPEETHEELAKWVRSLGLKPGWMTADAPITIDVAEHTITTRYVLTPEGTDGRTATPQSIPDGNGGVLTQPHVEEYDGDELPEVPAMFHTALDDTIRAELGV